jgi:recombination protein RecR
MALTLPYHLQQFALFLERFPGIGGKSATRLALYALRLPQEDLQKMGTILSELKEKTKKCKDCNNLTASEVCDICSSYKRDKTIVAVVETVLDVVSMESGNIYSGVYHVLHGKIDPLNYVRPEDIYIHNLLQRVHNNTSITEIILATGSDMEGETTAQYIKKSLEEIKATSGRDLTITRLAYGMPMGAQIEYADYMTLKKSLDGRGNY